MSIFGKKVQVGLNIGSYSLQGASLAANSHKPWVWRDVLFPSRDGIDDALTEHDLRARVKSFLKPHEKTLALTKGQVVLGIQGDSLTTGYLPLPKLKDEEIDMAVRSTVTREVPFPIDTLDIAHVPVEPLKGDKTAVFYSVWKKVTTHQLHEIAAFCNLTIRRLEATGIALTRELYRNRSLDPDAFYAIVDIGFAMTQILLVKGGFPYFLRDVPIGGKDITYAIQVGSQVSWEEAENVKKSLPLYEMIHTVNPVLSEIHYEVKRSLDYCCSRLECPQVAGVFLSGGTSLLADFPDWLEEELRLSVTRESWEKLDVADNEAPLHKVSVGLALGQ